MHELITAKLAELLLNPEILGQIPMNQTPKEMGQFLSGENWRVTERFCQGKAVEEFMEDIQWNGERSQPVILRCIQLHLLAKVGM